MSAVKTAPTAFSVLAERSRKQVAAMLALTKPEHPAFTAARTRRREAMGRTVGR